MDIPTAEFLAETSLEGKIAFEKATLEGPLFRGIIREIEDAALEGHTRFSKIIDASDDIRKLKVVQSALKDVDYYCEIEEKTKKGLLGQYQEQYFVIDWSKKTEGR